MTGNTRPISAPRPALAGVPDQGRALARVLCAIRSCEPRLFQRTRRLQLFSALSHRTFLREVTSADQSGAPRPHQGLPVPFGLRVVRAGRCPRFRSLSAGDRQAAGGTSIWGIVAYPRVLYNASLKRNRDAAANGCKGSAGAINSRLPTFSNLPEIEQSSNRIYLLGSCAFDVDNHDKW